MLKKINHFLLGLIVSALLVEGLLQCLPVSTGLALQAVNAQNPILRGMPGFNSIYSKGWNFRMANAVKVNNYGYPVNYDYQQGSRAILAIGDSYVQAAALSTEHKFYALLDQQLKSRGLRAFGLGKSGANLADYLAISRWGAAEFNVNTIYIVLIAGDFNDSLMPSAGAHHFGQSGKNYQLTLTDNPRKFKAVADIALSSAVLRYLLDNLSFMNNFMKVFAPAAEKANTDCSFDPLKESHPNLAGYILSEFKHLGEEKNLKIKFILDPAIRKQGDTPSVCERDVDRFARLAEAYSFEVIRLEDAFKAENARTGLRLDFSPVDDHWNSRAHAIVAEKILNSL